MSRYFYNVLLIFLIFSVQLSSLFAQSPEKDSIFIDFGSVASPSPWNNFNNPADGSLSDLMNSHGYITNVSIMVIDSFNGINTNGTTSPDPAIGILPSASGDSFFGNTAIFNGQSQPTGAFQISGLNTELDYNISIFASRVASDNRETQYIITGEMVDTVYLDPAINIGELASFSTKPDPEGNIIVHVSAGPNNANSSKFYYIGSLSLEYAHDPSIVPMDTVLLDLGDNLSPSPWNNLTNPADGSLNNLLNTRGLMTNYGVIVSDSFNNINTGGTTAPDPELGYPGNATGDSFFGNTSVFGGQIQETGGLDFTNLNVEKEYTFSIFSSRSASDIREAQYIITGSTKDTLYLDASSNTSMQVSTTVFPDENGVVNIVASPGPNNNNSSGFYYLGLVRMTYAFEDIMQPEPETDSTEILIDFGSTLSPTPWNNLEDPVAGVINNLISTINDSTGYSLKVTDDFNNINTGGSQNPAETINIPASASSDSFFGNVAEFGGQSQPTAGIEFGNLNPDKVYQFSIFASRVATDNREAQYILEGNSKDTVYLDASGNEENLAISLMTPSEDGIIKISVAPGPNNTNSSQFYYLGAIKVKYEAEIATPTTDTLLIDFGSILSPDPWNNMTDSGNGDLPELVKSDGYLSSYGIRVIDAFTGINDAGSQSPNPELGISPQASGDSFYGNTELWSGTIQETGGVQLYNLNPEKDYQVFIYASRTATDNRETQYIVESETIDTFYLQVASNTDDIVSITTKPDINGNITIIASPGPNNNNSFGFFYLGAMKVTYDHEEPSSDRTLSLIRPNGGESWQVGKTAEISWKSKNNPQVVIEYSTDGGAVWKDIATVNATTSYNWTIPDEPSTNCLVRLTADTVQTISAAPFEITNDNTSCHIVVLGSSTAAGTGASADSSWVERYTDFLRYNTKFTLTNLANGGYTTYHILPTGTDIPAGVGVTIDESKNVTAAINENPYAIIINMPSNDASSGFSVETQLNNFATIVNEANSKGIQVWIATTQPRNFSNPDQIKIQTDVRDSILSIYGDMAIDFWTDIADTDDMILETVNSGDGVHLNNKGHKILFERVHEKMIDTVNCTIIINTNEYKTGQKWNVKLFPNPTDGSFFIEIPSESTENISVTLVNLLGQKLFSQSYNNLGSGVQKLEINPQLGPQANPTLVYCIINSKYESSHKQKIIPLIMN